MGSGKLQAWPPNKRKLPALRYTSPGDGIEIAELSHQPTWHFVANESCFPLLPSYNLLSRFKRTFLPPDLQRATLQTLAHRILLMLPV